MSLGNFHIPKPYNEPVKNYAPGSPERASLQAEVARQSSEVIEIPCVIGGERVFSGNTMDLTMPCDHGHVLARVHMATEEMVNAGCDAAEAARADWHRMPWEERAAVFLRAADLLAGPWRDRLNASTMLGQGKTCYQAEIDSACELIDFWRFNTWFGETAIYAEQPPLSAPGVWNRMEARPLDGFVFAIAPFNFTSIALNLPTAPAMFGNTVVWKPATTGVLSCWYGMQLLEAAGLPPGVINMVVGRGSTVGNPVIDRPEFGGLHFTGSTSTFQRLWVQMANNLPKYGQYPRIVGETGGKDFCIAHASADPTALATAVLRGAYEYQGQKCSALSRLYVPKSLWSDVSEQVVAGLGEMKMGDVRDFSVFLGAVIDKPAFRTHQEYLGVANETGNVLAGGKSDDSKGWYIDATFVQVDDPHHRLMEEEIFGPVCTAYVYDDDKWSDALDLVDSTSPYALTGAVFADDRRAVAEATERLRFAAGNFYINDKPTGAVVGQQPFGGGRASGTNDKAGSPLNLTRWVNYRTIKETMVPATDWRYPFLG